MIAEGLSVLDITITATIDRTLATLPRAILIPQFEYFPLKFMISTAIRACSRCRAYSWRELRRGRRTNPRRYLNQFIVFGPSLRIQ